MQVLPRLSGSKELWVVAVGPMVTQQREFNALHKVPHMLVMPGRSARFANPCWLEGVEIK